MLKKRAKSAGEETPDLESTIQVVESSAPAFGGMAELTPARLRAGFTQAIRGWLGRTPSEHTRVNYGRDLQQFLKFTGIDLSHAEEMVAIRPEHVAAWRDQLQGDWASNSTIRRKMTVLRSLFSYLQVYGYLSANAAHSKFVKAPSVSRDGKTVGLSPADCRMLMDAPDANTPAGIRDRAILSVLAHGTCRKSVNSVMFTLLCVQGNRGKGHPT